MSARRKNLLFAWLMGQKYCDPRVGTDSKTKSSPLSSRILPLIGLLTVTFISDAYAAAGVPPFTGTQCPADRYGSKLVCTANDVRFGGIAAAAGSPTTCVAGSDITLNVNATVESGSAQRYNIGIFFGNDGKDIQRLSSTGGNASCSTYTFPTTPTPLGNLDGNLCGDTTQAGNVTVPLSNVTLQCAPGPDGKLLVPALVSWQQAPAACVSGDTYPVPGTTSKCNASTSSSLTTVQTYAKLTIKKLTTSGNDTFEFSTAGSSGTVYDSTASTVIPTFNLTTTSGASPVQVLSVPYSAGPSASIKVTELVEANWAMSGVECWTNSSKTTLATNVVPFAATTGTDEGGLTANFNAVDQEAYCEITNTPYATGAAALELIKTHSGTFTQGATFVPNGTSYTVTLKNVGNGNENNPQIVDVIPNGITVTGYTTGGNTALTCNPSTLVGNGSSAITCSKNGVFSGGDDASVTFQVSVDPNATGLIANTVTATAGSLNATATDEIRLPARPTVGKSVSPNKITSAGTSTLTITLGNPNAFPITLTSAFVDDLTGSNMSIPNTSQYDTNCPVAPSITSTSVTYPSGAWIPAEGCVINVKVTATSTGTNQIPASALQTDAGTNADPASATLTIVPTMTRPGLTKSFVTSPVAPGGVTELRVTLTNTNSTPLVLSSDLTDLMPAGLTLASDPTVSTTYALRYGTCDSDYVMVSSGTSTAGAQLLYTAGGTIPANSSCYVAVKVAAAQPSSGSTYTNQILSNALVTQGGSNSSAATAVLTVTSLTSLDKSFSPTSIDPGGITTLTLTLGNTSSSPLTLTSALTDNLPSGLTVANPNNINQTCPGTVTASASSSTVVYASGASIPAGGCTISVDVTSSTAGIVTNRIPAGSLVTNGGSNAEDATAGLIINASDMTAALSGFPQTLVPGQQVNGTLTCTNAGPGVADQATCAATGLPSGASVICDPTSPQASLAVGATISCAISYTAPSSGNVSLTGTAGSSYDSNPANNVAKETVAVSQTDMSVSLSGFPTAVATNDPVTGTVTCINAGPDAAVNPTCAATGLPSGAVVACTPNPVPTSLPPGGAMSCAVSYTAPDPATSPVTVIGTTGANNDSNGANNTASQAIPGSISDMSVSLSGFPATVRAGDTVTGTLTCINAGPDSAENVICNANGLPAGATVNCNPTSPQGSLPVGATMTCAVSYLAPDPVQNPITLIGATGANNDINLANNTASLVVPGSASDMAVSLTGFPSTVTAGQMVNGTVSCLNLGPTGATGPSCAVTGLPASPDTSVVCTPNPIPDPLEVGGLISCAVSYRAPSGDVTITGTANASNDINAANNQASLLVTGSASDMSANLIGFPTGPINPGSTVTGKLICTNNGPDSATTAICNVNGLPPNSTVLCSPTSPQNSLAVGGTLSCDVTYTAPGDGKPVTLVGVTNAVNDIDTTNNTAHLVLPGPLADMSVSLSDFPATVTSGQTVTGNVSCVNNGPSIAQNAFCTVVGLPANADVNCTPTSPQATFAVGAIMSCAVSYIAPDPATQPVTVTGVTNASNDANANNNTATQVVPGQPADLAVAMIGFPSAVSPGDVVNGTVSCVNNGPGISAQAFCNVGGLPTGAEVRCSPTSPQTTLNVGETINCAVTYTATSSPVTLTGNTGGANDPNPLNNVANLQVGTPTSDMSATLSGFPLNPLPGQRVNGVLTCLNAGPEVANNVTCNAAGLPDGASVTCTPTSPQSTLAVGSSLSCLVSYVAPATPVTIMGATSASNDTNLINNIAEQMPGPLSDMSVSLSGFPTSGTLTPGQTYTGNVACKNNGPSAATKAFCDVSIPGATVTCTPTTPQNNLAVGSTMNCAVSFVVCQTSSSTNCLAAANTATILGITGASNDADASNNTARITIPTLSAHVGVTVSGFPARTYAGQRVTGTVTCTSDGQITATNAYCNISGLPPGSTVSCTPSNTAAALPVGQSIVCQVSYIAPAGGTVNIVAITGAGNNSSTNQHIAVAQTVVNGSPPPNPIPTLGELGRMIMMLMMILSVGYYSRKMQRR